MVENGCTALMAMIEKATSSLVMGLPSWKVAPDTRRSMPLSDAERFCNGVLTCPDQFAIVIRSRYPALAFCRRCLRMPPKSPRNFDPMPRKRVPMRSGAMGIA